MAKGHGRPRKDFDLETMARGLSEPILLRYAEMGAHARTPQDVAAGRLVIAYGFGSPRERKEISGVGGGPIAVAPIDKMTTAEVRDELAILLAEARADGATPDPPDDDAADEPERP